MVSTQHLLAMSTRICPEQTLSSGMVCPMCRLLSPLYDQSKYVLCALASDEVGNMQPSNSALPFSTPDGAPPVLLLTAAAPRTAQPALTGSSSDAVFSQSGMDSPRPVESALYAQLHGHTCEASLNVSDSTSFCVPQWHTVILQTLSFVAVFCVHHDCLARSGPSRLTRQAFQL